MREHISGQYDAELDELRAMVTEMGGLVERQLQAVCLGLSTWDADPAEPVAALDKAVNRLEVSIDDACTHIIARRQPTASDLRLVMSIVKAITDLERIGDETTRIAKMLDHFHCGMMVVLCPAAIIDRANIDKADFGLVLRARGHAHCCGEGGTCTSRK